MMNLIIKKKRNLYQSNYFIRNNIYHIIFFLSNEMNTISKNFHTEQERHKENNGNIYIY